MPGRALQSLLLDAVPSRASEANRIRPTMLLNSLRRSRAGTQNLTSTKLVNPTAEKIGCALCPGNGSLSRVDTKSNVSKVQWYALVGQGAPVLAAVRLAKR